MVYEDFDEPSHRKNKAKQSQFISYWVFRKSTGRLTAESQGLRDAYCETEFEKTKPIFEGVEWA